jgi:hypothetical protein
MVRKRRRPLGNPRPEWLEQRTLPTTLIALVDTGVDLTSGDQAYALDSPYYDIADGYDAYSQQPAAPDGSNVADNSWPGHSVGHGATVANAIVAGIQATTSQPGASGASVKLMPVRDTIDSGSGVGMIDTTSLLRGIYYAASKKAAVINVSVGYAGQDPWAVDPSLPNYPNPTYLHDAINYAKSQGCVVVTAAGNDGYQDLSHGVNIDDPNNPFAYNPYPAYDHTMGGNLLVAASADPTNGNNLFPGSNWGPVHVDLASPLDPNNYLTNAWQTSFAAGYLSGVTGTVAALRPDFNVPQLIGRITSTVATSPQLSGMLITGGVLSPASAVDGLLSPTVVATASASPGTVSGTTTALSVLGSDAGGEASLTYNWQATQVPPNAPAPTFRLNHTNAAKNTTATFYAAGPYAFKVTVTDGAGYTATSSVTVIVSATPTSASLSPSNVTIPGGGTQTFSATVKDQFNAPISSPSLTWTVNSAGVGGTIDSTGKYTAPAAGSGIDTVRVTSGLASATAAVTVMPAAPGGVSIASGSGTAVGSFQADTDFSGGILYSTNAPIDTSAVTNPAPQQVYQTERYGNFTYTVPGLIPGGLYEVRLHFAEIYWNAAGKRLFNVLINGAPLLTNFDIFAAAGGMNKAIVETFTAQADGTGKIAIQYVTVLDNAKGSGIEIIPAGQASVAIDSGGPTAGSFAADTDYVGGKTYSTASTVDTSGVTDPAPQAVYQNERYGNFTYTIPNLTPGAPYTVRLDFAEIFWNAAGKRLFNVLVNGAQVLTNFDIFAAAGKMNRAIAETFTAQADGTGKITIQYVTVLDNAKSSGIEITPAGQGSVAIDSGGPAAGTFVADTDFVGGKTYSASSTIDTSAVTNPAPQAVYQTERYGNFTYALPNLTPGAPYTVRLDFAEIYWNAAGKRAFNVLINGAQVLTNLDIFAAAGGMNRAIAETFNTTADGTGKVTIQYVTLVDNAKSSGIEIFPGANAAASAVLTASSPSVSAASGTSRIPPVMSSDAGAAPSNQTVAGNPAPTPIVLTLLIPGRQGAEYQPALRAAPDSRSAAPFARRNWGMLSYPLPFRQSHRDRPQVLAGHEVKHRRWLGAQERRSKT